MKVRDPESARQSFVNHGMGRLSRLCHAVGLGTSARDAAGTFRKLLEPWGDRAIGTQPAWPSDIVDDHSPFELSVTFGGSQSEVRALVEAQGDAPTLLCQQEAGRALTLRLERDFGADLRRLRLVEDLFFPAEPQGIFAAWHAASFRNDRAPDLKIYLNLQAQGRARAPALAEEALARLGFAGAWPALRRIAGRRGPDEDELLYFSLDLSPHPQARAKIYFRNHRATAADLEEALSLSRNHVEGEVARMCRALGAGEGPYATRAPVSCFSYVSGDEDRCSEATAYFPICGYVTDDAEARARISAYLSELDIATAPYEAALEAFTMRPLDEGVGLQSYVSFRRDRGLPRVTVYLAPEAYHMQPPSVRSLPVAHPPSDQAGRREASLDAGPRSQIPETLRNG